MLPFGGYLPDDAGKRGLLAIGAHLPEGAVMLLVQRRRPYTSFVVKKAGSMGQKSSRVLCLGAQAVQRIQEPCQTRGPGSFPCLDSAAISDILLICSLIGSLETVGCCCLTIGMFRLSYMTVTLPSQIPSWLYSAQQTR